MTRPRVFVEGKLSAKCGTGPERNSLKDLSRQSQLREVINRLTRYRWVATRYEKRAATYLVIVNIARTLEWLSLCKQALVPGSPAEIAGGRRDRTLR